MKKYKTWELLKMADEATEKDKSRVFECTSEGCNIKGKQVRFSENGYLRRGLFDGIAVLNTRLVNYEWVEIQQPVPFMEAVKAYAEGKPVECEHEGHDKRYKFTPTSEKKTLLCGMPLEEDETGVAITTDDITKGRWYICND